MWFRIGTLLLLLAGFGIAFYGAANYKAAEINHRRGFTTVDVAQQGAGYGLTMVAVGVSLGTLAISLQRLRRRQVVLASRARDLEAFGGRRLQPVVDVDTGKALPKRITIALAVLAAALVCIGINALGLRPDGDAAAPLGNTRPAAAAESDAPRWVFE